MPVVALTWWEVAAAAGAFVTTQVARWQKVTQAQKSQEKKKKKVRSNLGFQQTSLSLWHSCYFVVKMGVGGQNPQSKNK